MRGLRWPDKDFRSVVVSHDNAAPVTVSKSLHLEWRHDVDPTLFLAARSLNGAVPENDPDTFYKDHGFNWFALVRFWRLRPARFAVLSHKCSLVK